MRSKWRPCRAKPAPPPTRTKGSFSATPWRASWDGAAAACAGQNQTNFGPFRSWCCIDAALNSAFAQTTNQQCQFHLCHMGQQPLMPQRCTLGSRRIITPRFSPACLRTAWIAKAHGHESDAVLVVKNILVQRHPVAQPIARWIVPGHARFMHPGARGLTNDEDFGAGAGLHHRAWPQR